jgi:hypothetical protein
MNILLCFQVNQILGNSSERYQVCVGDNIFVFLNDVYILFTDESAEIMQVRKFDIGDQGERSTLLTSSGGSTGSMDEKLQAGWEVEVDNVFKQRDIDTSSCEVGDDQEVEELLTELK